MTDYIEFLTNNVFMANQKWPHFKLLMDDLTELSKTTTIDTRILSLERTIMYGGWSLTAPIFSQGKFQSYDCSPVSADDRGSYNANLVNNPAFIKKIKSSRLKQLSPIPKESNSIDLIIIPNLLHHYVDIDFLLSEVSRILSHKGQVYVFDSILRELHQEPDDFARFTPYGLSNTLNKFNLKEIDVRTAGGPFEAITYCWIQALEYLPEEIRKDKEKWFYENHFNELLELDSKYPKNLSRKHTSFPVGYSVTASKS